MSSTPFDTAHVVVAVTRLSSPKTATSSWSMFYGTKADTGQPGNPLALFVLKACAAESQASAWSLLRRDGACPGPRQ